MNYLGGLFQREAISKLGGSGSLDLFGREISLDELLPIGSDIREDIFTRWLVKKGSDFNSKIDQLIKISENRHRVSELSNLYNSNEIIPFIGAGMSVPSGMITWQKMLEDLSDRIERPRVKEGIKHLIASHKYEDAANEIYNRLGKRLFNELLENRYRVLNPEDIKGAVKIVPDLFNGMIITTNFDNVLEYLLRTEAEETSFAVIEGSNLKDIMEPDYITRSIIKIHGDFKNPANRILLKSEYELNYSNRKFKRKLKKIFTDKSLLFLGCSLVSDRYMEIIKSIGRNDAARRHYALMKLPAPIGDRQYYPMLDREEKHLSKFNIFPIWIEDYQDMEAIFFTLLKLQAEDKLNS